MSANITAVVLNDNSKLQSDDSMMELILTLSKKILKYSLSLKEMIGEMDEDGSGTVDFEVSFGSSQFH